MKKKIFLLISIIAISCGSMNNQNSNQYLEMSQDFNEKEILGKWLTNYKRTKKQFQFFNADGTFISNAGDNGTYRIKKDSIYLFRPNQTAKGRLLKQTDKELFILWGNSEPIKYVRPKKMAIKN